MNQNSIVSYSVMVLVFLGAWLMSFTNPSPPTFGVTGLRFQASTVSSGETRDYFLPLWISEGQFNPAGSPGQGLPMSVLCDEDCSAEEIHRARNLARNSQRYADADCRYIDPDSVGGKLCWECPPVRDTTCLSPINCQSGGICTVVVEANIVEDDLFSITTLDIMGYPALVGRLTLELGAQVVNLQNLTQMVDAGELQL